MIATAHPLEDIFNQQEAICFEDLIGESYIDGNQSIHSIDEYLTESQSFLIIKLFDNRE